VDSAIVMGQEECVGKSKISEKLLLEKIRVLALALRVQQRDLAIGPLMVLIRSQLKMSQRALALRAKVPQSTISKMESGVLQPNVATLHKVFNAMECDVLITAIPRERLDIILQKQVMAKAKKRVEYLQGTMSLEKQKIDSDLLNEFVQEEAKSVLDLPSSKLWENK